MWATRAESACAIRLAWERRARRDEGVNASSTPSSELLAMAP